MADTEHLHPVFLRRIEAALADYPNVYVLSGARSNARQAQLYDDFLRGTGNPANPPGTSWHEYDEKAPWPNVGADESAASRVPGGCWAMAVDLAGDYSGINRNAAAYGLCFPIAGERWHAQPIEIGEAKRVTGAWRRLAVPVTTPPTPPTPPDPYNADSRTVLHFIGD